MHLLLPLGKYLAAILLGYALGCFATGYYLVRWRTGQDLRRLGSGATGGRNAGRLLGRPGLVVTAIGDILKGALAESAALLLGLQPWALTLVLLAVVAGHIYPAQLGFRGGKGLGPSLGAMLVIDYRIAAVMVVLIVVFTAASQQLTLSMMLVVAVTPVAVLLAGRAPAEALGVALTALLILFAHRLNILEAVHRFQDRRRKST